MQIKTAILIKLLIAASLSCVIGNVVAQENPPSLEQALKDTGWSVQRELDGSLILNPRLSSKNAATEKSSEEHWLKIQSKLQAAGWKVDRESDGSLILVPPAAGESQAVQKIDPMLDMQQKLQSAGWIVSKKPDGSLLLYPPGDTVSAKPEPTPGILPSLKLSLPVNSWQTAYEISQGWLDKQPPFGAAVGKIRKIFRIYLVSIVSEQSPYKLLQQIAIRNSDGAVIVLN